MKRSDSPRKKARVLSVARAKMLIKAHMGWMYGVPSRTEDAAERALTWTTHQGERVVVTRETLSQAKRTLHELQREPAILSAAVDDADTWVRGVERVLAGLNDPIHRGHAIPSALDDVLGPLVAPRLLRRGLALRAREPRLTRLLDSLGWACALHPERFDRALQIVERGAERFARIEDPVLGVRLVSLATDEGEEKIEPLFALIFDERSARVPTSGEPTSALASTRSAKRKAESPSRSPRPNPRFPSGSADLPCGFMHETRARDDARSHCSSAWR